METHLERAKAYGPGHPWYYVLGGHVHGPKAILSHVQQRGYKGYRAEQVEKTNAKEEPHRSEVLRLMRNKALADYRQDLSCYRGLARELHYDRKINGLTADGCKSIHTNLSLKYNHLFNDLAHLFTLDEHLAVQPDLFE